MNDFFFDRYKRRIILVDNLGLKNFPPEIKKAICSEQGWTDEQFDNTYRNKYGVIEDLIKRELMEYIEKEYPLYWKFIDYMSSSGDMTQIPNWLPTTLFLSMWSTPQCPNGKMQLPFILKIRKILFFINLKSKVVNDSIPFARNRVEYKSKYGFTLTANIQDPKKFNKFLPWFLNNQDLIREIVRLYQSMIKTHYVSSTIWPVTYYCYYRHLGLNPFLMMSAIRGLIHLSSYDTLLEYTGFIKTQLGDMKLQDIIEAFKNYYPIESSSGLLKLKNDILKMKDINDKFVNLGKYNDEFKNKVNYQDALYNRNIKDEKLTSYVYEVFLNLMHYEDINTTEDEI